MADLTDLQYFALTLYGETRGEPIEGQIAVGCVIRNRVEADLHGDGRPDWWGEGYTGVCLAPWQFSCWWETGPNSERVYAAAAGGPVPAELAAIADGVLAGRLADITGGATHYLTAARLKIAAPAWVAALRETARIGHHVFFRAA